MPELPEVETVRRGLAPVMEGQVIARAQVNRPDLRWPFPPDMAGRLTGRRVVALRRRSKYILADLDSGESLLIHLGMSGRMLVSGDPLGRFVHDHPAAEKHDHVVLDMANGARITFNDPRRFGAMDLLDTATADRHKLLSVIGPEPLGNDFNEPYLVAALKDRNTPVKSALLDQRIVAGLGNIYVCEALFRARISPRRRAGQIAATRVAGSGADHPPGAVRGDRGGRVESARFPAGGWRTWLFPAQFRRLRPRGRSLPQPGLHGDDCPHRAGGTVLLLLSIMPKMT